MTREKLELFTAIRDLSTQFYVILKRASIESDLDMRFAIWSLGAFHEFSFFKHSS